MATDIYNRKKRKINITSKSELKSIAKMNMGDPKQFKKAMDMITNAVEEMLAQEAYDKAYEILEKQWYGRPESEYYKRTGDLLAGLNVKQDKNGNYVVGVDGRALRQEPRAKGNDFAGSLGTHMGFNDEPVSSEIWMYVNEGNDSSAISYNGIDVIGQVEEYINSVAKRLTVKFLRENGFDAK